MGTVATVQANFTRGELSELLLLRSDFDGFYKGVRQCRNFLPLPQGALKRAFGTSGAYRVARNLSADTAIKYAILKDGATIYDVIFTNNNAAVYLNGTLEQNVTTTYATAALPNLQWTQNASVLVIFDSGTIPRLFFYDTTSAMWVIQDAVFINYPTQTSSVDISSDVFSVSSASGNTTLTATTGTPFTTAMVGGLFFGGGGAMRIQAYTSTTVVTGAVIPGLEFTLTSAIQGSLSLLREPAYSASKGYPTCGVIYQNRLILGGTQTYPNMLAFSVIGDFFNFDDSEGPSDASSGFTTAVHSNFDGQIVRLLGDKTLAVFSTEGVYTPNSTYSDGITPSIYFDRQTSTPVQNSPATFIDGFIAYINNGGQIINGMTYNVAIQDFEIQNLNVTTDVVNAPVSLTSLTAPTNDAAQFLIVLNGDGTLATYTSLRSQDIAAWALHPRTGYYLQVQSDLQTVRLLVKRTINGNTDYFIEQMDFDSVLEWQLDQVFGGGTTTVTGLTDYIGESVYIIADGNMIGSKTVSSGGTVSLDTSAVNVSVGLNFTPTVQPMPPIIKGKNGTDVIQPRKITSLWISFLNSAGLAVQDNNLVHFLTPLDTANPLALQTGLRQYSPAASWNPSNGDFANLLITQTQPFQCTLRGLLLVIASTVEVIA